jgi:hypothetical protein
VVIESELRTSARRSTASAPPARRRIRRFSARARLDEPVEEREISTHVEGSRAVAKIRHEIGLCATTRLKEQSAGREQGRRLEVLRAPARLESELASWARRRTARARAAGTRARARRDVVARRLDAYQRELESPPSPPTWTAQGGGGARARACAPITVIPVGRARALGSRRAAFMLGAGITDWLSGAARRAPAV